jgi:TRAP transporter TAXI family solute receptor
MNFMSLLGAAALFATTGFTANAQDRTYVSFGSCPVGCTSYTWTAGIADVLNRNMENFEAVAEGTRGYIDNARLLSAGDIQVAMATTASAVDAYNGVGVFDGVEPGRVLSWMSIAPTYMHVITLESDSISSLEELRGMRVGMGQPGGTSLIDNEALMSTLGLIEGDDFEAFKIRLGPMLDGLADGNIDVVLWDGSIPLGPVIQISSTQSISLLEITDDELAALQVNNPAFFRVTIPGGTYRGVDEDVAVFGNGNAMTIDAELPEELVYEMTRVIMTNLDTLGQVHPALAALSPATVLRGFSVPLHPGALRYYREIGVPGIEEFAAQFPSE